MDSTLVFELFSLQGIAAIMMFGLTGMFVVSATDQEIIAVISGGFAGWLAIHGKIHDGRNFNST